MKYSITDTLAVKKLMHQPALIIGMWAL